ncbi:sensor histidine kinase [Halalkalibacter hemicellulosilyticus]|uniref:Two-component sensor histidine kinase n=1 Tax=Halalkalibacter hemicellulosilyticusJCM 9152 TaxID=1236971 RepID=W4QEG7_9BACI|nr:sensor histidine kinase [Halalkalibacter hemicellulosilyticus]GAE30465.1 two-component sensor histidine kinase [Halalkalibacter hemicellulosilyticusJCM 9152]
MFKKLTTIMVISFVLVNGVFLAALSMASYRSFFNFTSEEISETRLTLLNESAKKLAGFISSVSEAGVYIAINRNVIEMFSDEPDNAYDAISDQRELISIMNGVTSMKTFIHSIEVYTNHYEEYPIVSGEVVQPMNHVMDEKWFPSLFSKADYAWVPKHESIHTSQEFISYMHRLMNQRGETVGYIKVNVTAETFFEYMSDKELLNQTSEPLILLNTGGRIIAETHTSEVFPILDRVVSSMNDEPFSTLTEDYQQITNHHELIRYDNDYFLLLLSEPNYDQWRLAQVIPVDGLYTETRQMGIMIFAMGLLGLLISIPIVYWIGKRFSLPISNLIKGMRSIEKGDFNQKVGPYYIEEYDVLASSFNRMTKELNESVKRLKAESGYRREAEIRALQSQIMPHFLYNTLDMIRWKAMDHRANDISDMVNQLSRMLRIGLSGGNKFILLRDELEHVKSYIQIQQTRLTSQVHYHERVKASLKDLYVPKIILQPLSKIV